MTPIWKDIQHDIEMEERVNDAIIARKQDMKVKRQNSHDSLYFTICSSNLFPHLNQEELRNILDTVVKSCEINISEDELKMLVMERIFSENQKKQQKKKNTSILPIKNSNLLVIYDDAINKKQHPYDLLKKKGYIKNPFEEFMRAK